MEMDKFSDEVRGGAAEVGAVGGHLEHIIDQVHDLGPRFDTVKDGMRGQAAGAGQISEAMSQLALAVDKTRESLHEFKIVTEQLGGAVQGLQQEVSRFTISG
jgi:methyl-accepting chemotaxis protein WspA